MPLARRLQSMLGVHPYGTPSWDLPGPVHFICMTLGSLRIAGSGSLLLLERDTRSLASLFGTWYPHIHTVARDHGCFLFQVPAPSEITSSLHHGRGSTPPPQLRRLRGMGVEAKCPCSMIFRRCYYQNPSGRGAGYHSVHSPRSTTYSECSALPGKISSPDL